MGLGKNFSETRLDKNFLDKTTDNAFGFQRNPDFTIKHRMEINRSITISFAGDCTLGTDKNFGYYGTLPAVLDVNSVDKNYLFKNVQAIFGKDDITVVNLEGTFTSATRSQDKLYNFKGPKRYAEFLKNGSVEYVNLSNNHSYDYFQVGFDDTKAALAYYGVGKFCDDSATVATANKINIGLLGYYGFSKDQGLLRQMRSDITNLRAGNCNLVVVSFHWGVEQSYLPNSTQIFLAHYAIDHGADLVVGHHPHVLQGAEIYKKKAIFYSLGNFAFGGNNNPRDKDTIILQLKYEQNTIGYQLRIIPCSISSRADVNNYQPTPLHGSEAKRVIGKFNNLSRTSDFNVSTDFKLVGL